MLRLPRNITPVPAIQIHVHVAQSFIEHFFQDMVKGTFAIVLQDSCGFSLDVFVADAVPPVQSVVFSEVPKHFRLSVVIVTQGGGAFYLFDVSKERLLSPSQHLSER